jgi:1,2-phenylacetyl-CoA epoxidase catalytic subunit
VSAELKSFDDFREYSLWYLRDVGLDIPEIMTAEFKVVLAQPRTDEIEFGHFAGKKKWRSIEDMPEGDWNGRGLPSILANLANIQGDTEFGSNELQTGLWDRAPSDYDRKVLLSVIIEEFRHGWQMGFFETEVLKTDEARTAAQTLLERRASESGNERLLGAFNNPIKDWLGMYCFLEFMDRDGGSQLTLLQHSSVEALSRSMIFMLREEAKHLRSGEQGFERILRAGKLPVPVIQRYVNLFAPLGYDLHGGERSTNALIYFNLGLKGFYPSPESYLEKPASVAFDPQLFHDLVAREKDPVRYSYKFIDLNLGGATKDVNKELLNGITVTFYKRTLEKHFEKFNKILRESYPKGTPELVLPSLRWNRAEPSIYASERWDIHGNPIATKEEFDAYRRANLPTDEDRALVEDVLSHGGIAPPEQDVYKELTHTKPSDDVLFQTRFGTSARSTRFTKNLSRAAAAAIEKKPATPAAPASAPAPAAKTADEVPFWQLMEDAGG